MVTDLPDSPTQNVVYLTEEHGIVPGPPRGHVAPNPHAHEYGQPALAAAQSPPPAGPPARPVPDLSELVPPPMVDDNPFGDFFSDGPTAWLADEDEAFPIDTPRLVGTSLAIGAVLLLVGAWLVWGIAMWRGSGGAEAGGLILLSMMLWVWYLGLGRSRQHAFMLRWHVRVQGVLDRRIAPIRTRTEGQLLMRRERERYRAMSAERDRRIDALGESAYRLFRQGTLGGALQSGAQRVAAIEMQMLGQDRRIHQLVVERAAAKGGSFAGTDPAAGTPEGGHSAP